MADNRAKKDKQKVGHKGKQKKKTESDAESDLSSEEDGYMDSKEMDYLSDSSASSEGKSSCLIIILLIIIEITIIAPTGFGPEGQNPRRHPGDPRVLGTKISP